MTYEEIRDYYAGLLISQYRRKPKARETVKLCAGQFFCDGIAVDELNNFNLETASGEQLDFIGNIVGVKRRVYGINLDKTFARFIRYEDEDITGVITFGRYEDDPYPDAYVMRYVDGVFYTLTDAPFRRLIRLKIIYNHQPATTKALVEALWSTFGNNIVLTDNADFSVTFDVSESHTMVMIAAEFLKIIPCPMGVSYTINHPE